jgi:hypothetical protein
MSDLPTAPGCVQEAPSPTGPALPGTSVQEPEPAPAYSRSPGATTKMGYGDPAAPPPRAAPPPWLPTEAGAGPPQVSVFSVSADSVRLALALQLLYPGNHGVDLVKARERVLQEAFGHVRDEFEHSPAWREVVNLRAKLAEVAAEAGRLSADAEAGRLAAMAAAQEGKDPRALRSEATNLAKKAQAAVQWQHDLQDALSVKTNKARLELAGLVRAAHQRLVAEAEKNRKSLQLEAAAALKPFAMAFEVATSLILLPELQVMQRYGVFPSP